MYFPWVGLLEQVRTADVFVHYDDVQLARGFYNRVQVKTEHGTPWLTVPLRDQHRGQRIDETKIDDRVDWRSQHRDILRLAYRHAPFQRDMLLLVDGVFAREFANLSELARASTLALAEYFDIAPKAGYLDSVGLNIEGRSSQRLLDIVTSVGGTQYVTGHGARNYLDHEMFERARVAVEYMNYRSLAYAQLHGAFTPFVTGLDLVANCGREGVEVIVSDSVDWRSFVSQPA